ncbi:HNH/ENDO VII family nuclease [Herbaspirillum sp. AP02]|nr:HNH/ENDO VII family nuclease [Herbaspirillum sp. AP02]NZD69750.1 HNH/ENDO VII family nuclease [Herbaspirillum sp. AP21]
MGNASLMGTDVDQAREVATFRSNNCGGLSAAACDGLVRDAINYRLLRVAALSAVAAATPALLGEARKLVQPKEKSPAIIPDRDRYTADQDLPNVYSDPQVAKIYFGQERKYWSTSPQNFLGNMVYQRDDLIDPERVDAKTGKTNLELMQAGRAPIGSDGNPINLHHMLQSQDGPIAEVTQSFHRQNFSAIHINAGSDIPSGINRSEFNTWRSNYWKNRASDFR